MHAERFHRALQPQHRRSAVALAAIPFVDTNEPYKGPRLLALDLHPQVADGVTVVIDDATEIVPLGSHALRKQHCGMVRRGFPPLLNWGAVLIGKIAGEVVEDRLLHAMIFAVRHWPKCDHGASRLLFSMGWRFANGALLCTAYLT